MKKNLFKISFLLLSIIFFIHGCKKDTKILSDMELIAKSKEWFHMQQGVSFIPNWDLAQVDRLDNKQFIVLPTNFQLSVSQNNIQSILVIDVSENETKGNIVEIISSDNITSESSIKIATNYLLNSEKSVFPNETDFNILLFDIKYVFLKGDFISQGQHVGSIGLKTNELTPELSPKKLMGDRNSTKKERSCTDYYYILRYVGGPIISETYLFTVCDGGGDSGGGSSVGSGSSGADIKNKTKDPCISKTVNAAITANKNLVGMLAGIIQHFDASKTVTLNIFDGTTTNGFPGQYQGGGYVGNKFQANITLQTDYFKNSSKESVITTVIHEFVHAYIHTSGNKILEKDHDAISNNYITPMATYLQSYFSIPLKDAYALAWGGVPDSKAWDLAALDFEFTMSDGNKITKQETMNLSGPYKDNGNQLQYKKGTPLCN